MTDSSTVMCVTVNQHALPLLESLNSLCNRLKLGLLGAKCLLPEVVVFSGTSNLGVHYLCLPILIMVLLM